MPARLTIAQKRAKDEAKYLESYRAKLNAMKIAAADLVEGFTGKVRTQLETELQTFQKFEEEWKTLVPASE